MEVSQDAAELTLGTGQLFKILTGICIDSQQKSLDISYVFNML